VAGRTAADGRRAIGGRGPWRRQLLVLLEAGDHRLARLLLDLADAILELQAVLGNFARAQRRVQSAELTHKSGACLFIDGTARGAIILRQRLDRLAYELFVVSHSLFETHGPRTMF